MFGVCEHFTIYSKAYTKDISKVFKLLFYRGKQIMEWLGVRCKQIICVRQTTYSQTQVFEQNQLRDAQIINIVQLAP